MFSKEKKVGMCVYSGRLALGSPVATLPEMDGWYYRIAGLQGLQLLSNTALSVVMIGAVSESYLEIAAGYMIIAIK